jgi:hypothetical protein
MTMSRKHASLVVCLLMVPTSAFAQQIGSPNLKFTTATGGPATCEDFTKLDDNSWETKGTVLLEILEVPAGDASGVSMSKGSHKLGSPLHFQAHVLIDGVDMAGQLDAACGKNKS